MPYTFPNQRKIVIHKEYPKSDFLQIKNEHWTYINKKYSPYGLQLYLYLAKNKDGFELALSPEAAEQEAGIKKTTFHKYLNIFIADGYLVERNGNTYDFYETPHKQEERSLPYVESGSSDKEQRNPQSGQRSSADEVKAPWDNKEIYKKDNIDIIDIEVDIKNSAIGSKNRQNISEYWNF